jgi:hypothetical protein
MVQDILQVEEPAHVELDPYDELQQSPRTRRRPARRGGLFVQRRCQLGADGGPVGCGRADRGRVDGAKRRPSV